MIYTKFEKCPITKVKVVILHPVQQAMVILGGDNLGLDAKLANH